MLVLGADADKPIGGGLPMSFSVYKALRKPRIGALERQEHVLSNHVPHCSTEGCEKDDFQRSNPGQQGDRGIALDGAASHRLHLEPVL